MAVVHIGDAGVAIRLTVTQDGAAKNIAAASVKTVKLLKPSGEIVSLTTAFVTDGTNGQLEGQASATDLDEAGPYAAFAYLVLGSWTGHSNALKFSVRPLGQ